VSRRITLADNRCFQNCYWALQHVPGNATLVIGLATLDGRTVRHAWIESDNGIVDPSWVGLLDNGDSPDYQAVHRYTKAQVKKLLIMKLGRVHREPVFSEWYQLNTDGD
jgi:hypothetical protein